jgi:TP901 family phage tail tape measure protein
VSKNTQFAAHQAGEAYFFLASAGLNAEQSLKSMPIVAKFAQAGNFDLALATDLVTDAQSALGIASKDTTKHLEGMNRVSDVLVKANTLANASVQQFSESLTNKAGSALKIVGKDIEEGVAVLAAFADQGIKGANSGNALNIVMRDLQTKAIRNAAAFQAAGVGVFDAAGEMRNMADIVSDLERLLGGLSDQQKKSTLLTLGFTDKSIAFTQSLIGTSDKIRGYETALRDAGGTSEMVANKSLTDLQKALNSTRGEWERLVNAMGPKPVGMVANALELAAGIAAGDTEGFSSVKKTRSAWQNVIDSMSKDKFRTASQDILGSVKANDPNFGGAGKAIERQLGFHPIQASVPHIIKAIGVRAEREAAETEALLRKQENFRPTELALEKIGGAFDFVRSQSLAAGVKVTDLADKTEKGFNDLAKAGFKQLLIDGPRNMDAAAKRQRRITEENNRKLQTEADSLFRSVMTDAEKAQASIGRAMDLFKDGLVGEDTIQRMITQWDDRLRTSSTKRHLGFAEMGSREAFDATRNRKEPISEVAKNSREMLQVLKDIRDGKAKPIAGSLGDVNVTMHSIA